MGAIRLTKLPEYFDKWGVAYELHGDWLNVSRSSGGFDMINGVVVHHTAGNINGSLANSINYALTGPANPIGNGTVSRSKDGPKVAMYAGGAANTAGAGGPRLTSRGVIAKDNANRVTVNFEAENNGIGEAWPDDMCNLYVRAVVATLDWANNETPGALLGPGDVFAHFEWTTRKIDPWGPSRFTGGQNKQWDMDAFRGEVFALMVAGPGGEQTAPPPPDLPEFHDGTPLPPIAYQETSPAAQGLIGVLHFWGWYPASENGSAGTIDDPAWQGIVNMQRALNTQPQDGDYQLSTAEGYSQFLYGMDSLVGQTCTWPPTSKIGATGDAVRALQDRLRSHGFYRYNTDGKYGPLTTQAVQQLQLAVRGAGHDPGPIDGGYGDRTRSAACSTYR